MRICSTEAQDAGSARPHVIWHVGAVALGEQRFTQARHGVVEFCRAGRLRVREQHVLFAVQRNDVQVSVWHLKSCDHEPCARCVEGFFLGEANDVSNTHEV